MIVTIKTSALREALAACARVVPSASPIDIIKGVLVRCEEQRLKVYATSNSVDLEVDLGDYAHDFVFAVSAERLKQYVDRSQAEVVKITLPENTDGGQLSFNGGNARGKLNLLTAADFPRFNEPKGDPLFDVELPLNKIMPEVLWASGSGMHLKPEYQGVTLAVNGIELKAFTCDGVRACTLRWEIDDGKLPPHFITIDVATAKLISQVFGSAGVTAYRGKAVIEAAGFRMGVPLILEGDELAIISKLPPVKGKTFTVDTARLLSAARAAASMVTTKRTPAIHLSEGVLDDDGGGVITITGTGPDGDFSDDVPVTRKALTGLNCDLNAQHLIAALGGVANETVTVIVPATPMEPHKIVSGKWEAFLTAVKV